MARVSTIGALPVLLTACTGPGASSATGSSVDGARAAKTITIRNFAFSPERLTVRPGATVRVKNEDSSTHTLTSTAHLFDTGDLNSGAVRSFRAPSKPGPYPYICTIHQFMTGTLVVSSS